MKRLFRTEKKIAGVCGGLGEYFEIDPTIVRLLVIVAALATAVAPVLIGYVIAWIVVPARPAGPVQTA